MTRATLRNLQPQKSKYRNVRCVVAGETFDSKAEGQYWLGLKAREAAGEIKMLQRQVTFPLYCPVFGSSETAVEVARYVADFVWMENGQRMVADKKGKRTREYLLKRKWLELQQGIVIREV